MAGRKKKFRKERESVSAAASAQLNIHSQQMPLFC